MSENKHRLPWKRGIGNDACKIWDCDGHLVCELETSSDSTFLVDTINQHAPLQAEVEGLREYVVHKRECDVFVDDVDRGVRQDCTCGLASLLSKEGEP